MSKTSARLLFILVPAVFFGVLLSFVHPAVGLLAFAAMAAAGYDVTKARPERGEDQDL